MRDQTQHVEIEALNEVAPLDLVVPFINPYLTRAAIQAAEHFGAGLHTTIRLIKVQTVPFPLPPDQSPVDLCLVRRQLAAFHSTLPITTQVRLARDFEPELLQALGRESTVVLASRKRPWKTGTERLAARLIGAGCRVVLVYSEA